jgi:hypothetical protein
MILQQREAGSISTQCSVSSRDKVLNEEDTRLGRYSAFYYAHQTTIEQRPFRGMTT